jgi:Adaptor complexes medium subunit family
VQGACATVWFLSRRVRPSSDAICCAHRRSIELDDVTFHQCVDLTRFSGEKTITFVPPDGAFELMKYRVTDNVTLPFKVLPLIKEIGRSRIEVTVKLRASGFTSALNATAVVVRIPVPNHTAGASIDVTAGKAKYKADISCLVWKLARLSGQDEVQLSANVELVRHPCSLPLCVVPLTSCFFSAMCAGEYSCRPQGVEQAAHHDELSSAHVH